MSIKHSAVAESPEAVIMQLNAAPARAQREQQTEDFEQILTAYKMHGYSKGAKGIYM